jgi:hypothetical protein
MSKRLTVASANMALKILRVGQAFRDGLINENPAAARVTTIKRRGDSPGRRAFTLQEADSRTLQV